MTDNTERRMLTKEDLDKLMAEFNTPEGRAAVAEDYYRAHSVEVDNPMRRETRWKRGFGGTA